MAKVQIAHYILATRITYTYTTYHQLNIDINTHNMATSIVYLDWLKRATLLLGHTTPAPCVHIRYTQHRT